MGMAQQIAGGQAFPPASTFELEESEKIRVQRDLIFSA
jgi:hypothetical protein